MQGEATRITLLVTQTLEDIGIPYALGGSLASSLHGVMHAFHPGCGHCGRHAARTYPAVGCHALEGILR